MLTLDEIARREKQKLWRENTKPERENEFGKRDPTPYQAIKNLDKTTD